MLEAKTPEHLPVELVISSVLAVAMRLVEDEDRTTSRTGSPCCNRSQTG